MDTCFLFTQHLNDEGCFSLKLDEEGQVIERPMQRSFDEILQFQSECQTFIIETSLNASLFELDLPPLTDRKVRVVIPFALEDKVSQPLDELHFAFARQRGDNQHYLVVLIAKKRMLEITQRLSAHGIQFNLMTLDWFALKNEQYCMFESELLINTKDFKGGLPGTLASLFVQQNQVKDILLFEDSHAIESTLAKNPEPGAVYIARNLLFTKPLDLCQGEFQLKTNDFLIKKGYAIVGALFLFWAVTLVLVPAVSLYLVNKQTLNIDRQIAEIYHEFFPESKQVISPRFRINQLISHDALIQSRFWFLLNQLSQAIKNSDLKILQIRYHNNTLVVQVESGNFEHLAQVKQQLKKLKVNTAQTQAATQHQKVHATLELK